MGNKIIVLSKGRTRMTYSLYPEIIADMMLHNSDHAGKKKLFETPLVDISKYIDMFLHKFLNSSLTGSLTVKLRVYKQIYHTLQSYNPVVPPIKTEAQDDKQE